ncbi:hypothetical protein Q2941_38335 [Bradyrhizobium sp. UFLA05-153]
MKEHDGLAVGGSGGRHVHVRHAQLLAFDGEVEELHGMGIFDVLEADADRLHRLSRRGRSGIRRLRPRTVGQRNGTACECDGGQQ